MKIKITIKDIIKDIIIICLFILLILSKIDFKINMLNGDNWIDIILCMVTIIPPTILSYLMYKQADRINTNQRNFEIKMMSKQLDSDLREERLKIFCEFNTINTMFKIADTHLIILNFLSGQHDKNSVAFDELYAKLSKISVSYSESKILFKDDKELQEKLGNIVVLYTNYLDSVREFIGNIYVANEESIVYLNKNGYNITTKWIPKELIDKDPHNFEEVIKIFDKYTSECKNSIEELTGAIYNDDFIELFSNYINVKIEKEGECK